MKLNSDYYDFYRESIEALNKRALDTFKEDEPALPADCTSDKLGYIIANVLPEAEAEEGSPLAAVRDTKRTEALKYLTSLSELEVFQNAAGTMNKVNVFPWYYGSDIEIFIFRAR